MSVPIADQKALWGAAAALCSFVDVDDLFCRVHLVQEAPDDDPSVIIGENAHIEGEKPTAARYRADMTEEQRNAYENLLLMCPTHHTVIDKLRVETFSVPRLKAMKAKHEAWIHARLNPRVAAATPAVSYVTDDLHSSLLEVELAPQRLFRVKLVRTHEETWKELGKGHHNVCILRGGELYTFGDPRSKESGLGAATSGKPAPLPFNEVWADEGLKRHYVELFKKCLMELVRSRGLWVHWKKNRAFFPSTDGKPRKEKYKTLAGSFVSRGVAWRPKTKKTGLEKHYWVHRAIELNPLHVGGGRFVVEVRPGFHFTNNGKDPLPPDEIGPLATKRLGQMWNHESLQEVRFWTSYLGDRGPRLLLKMAGQSIAVSCTLMRTQISWPGVKDDKKTFKEPIFQDDLFSDAEFQEAKAEDGTWDEDLFSDDE